MLDILKFIHEEASFQDDPDGNMLGAEPWSEDIAEQYAADEGIELTAAHWAVIRFLRQQFCRKGMAPSARILCSALDEEFSHQGGTRYLFQLFPGGPVAQACYIAGLPLPDHGRDSAEGSCM